MLSPPCWSSGVAPGLPQEWLSDGEWGLGREMVPFCAALRDGGPLREGQWKTPKFIFWQPERRGS